MKLFFCACIMFLPSLVFGQMLSNPSADTQQLVFNKVERVGLEKWRSFFMFPTTGHGYTIRSDGFVESVSGKTGSRVWKLTVGQNGHIERVYSLEYAGDLLLLYEVTDDHNGWGYMARLNQKTMSTRWLTPVSGFNIGVPLVESGYLYVTAANLIGKIDLHSGTYVWKNDDLQQRYSISYRTFDSPTVVLDRVIFRKEGGAGESIEADKTTGRVLSVHQ